MPDLTDEELDILDGFIMNHAINLRKIVKELRDARNRIKELEKLLNDAQLSDIQARNPGIDMEAVKESRKEHGGRGLQPSSRHWCTARNAQHFSPCYCVCTTCIDIKENSETG